MSSSYNAPLMPIVAGVHWTTFETKLIVSVCYRNPERGFLFGIIMGYTHPSDFIPVKSKGTYCVSPGSIWKKSNNPTLPAPVDKFIPTDSILTGKLFLIPIVLVLILFAGILILGQISSVSPFIYAIF